MFLGFSISNAAGWVTYGKSKKEKYSPDSIATDGEGELHSKNWGQKGLERAIFFSPHRRLHTLVPNKMKLRNTKKENKLFNGPQAGDCP